MRAIFAITSVGLLVACTPSAPTMGLEEAQTYCRGKVSKPVNSELSLGVGVGTGGKVRPSGELTIGVDLNSLLTPEETYASCVQNNAGQAPIVPLNGDAQG